MTTDNNKIYQGLKYEQQKQDTQRRNRKERR